MSQHQEGQTVAVRYVGKKPTAQDNVAKSGKCWQGNGDVQYVTARQAKALTGYPDQWALDLPEDEGALQQAAPGVEIVNGAGEAENVPESDLTGPLEKMTVAQLLAYAQLNYGKVLSGKLGRKVLLDEVLALDE